MAWLFVLFFRGIFGLVELHSRSLGDVGLLLVAACSNINFESEISNGSCPGLSLSPIAFISSVEILLSSAVHED